MTTYIRVENNTIMELLETESDIQELFHPSAGWRLCEQKDVQLGFVLQGNKWVLSTKVEELSLRIDKERMWRNMELVRADEELNKVQDSDSKARGSVADWRTYRKLLRSLPEHPSFPDVSARPQAPDYI